MSRDYSRIHWQLGVGPTRAICGLDDAGDEGRRCLSDCAHCEGDRDKVNCDTCLALGAQLLENLAYFHRADGPHPQRGSAS